MNKRQNDIELLSPTFKPLAKEILALIEYHKLPFKPFETLRSLDLQKEYLASGRSKTLKSKHLDGNAIDLVVNIDGKWIWDQEKGAYLFFYDFLGDVVKFHLGNKVIWGGDWKSLVDLPHFELNTHA